MAVGFTQVFGDSAYMKIADRHVVHAVITFIGSTYPTGGVAINLQTATNGNYVMNGGVSRIEMMDFLSLTYGNSAAVINPMSFSWDQTNQKIQMFLNGAGGAHTDANAGADTGQHEDSVTAFSELGNGTVITGMAATVRMWSASRST